MIHPHTQVDTARQIAFKVHSGQKYFTGEKFLVHPRAVVESLRIRGYPAESLAAAWLHDVVEKSDVTIEDLAEQEFSLPILRGVADVTYLDPETEGIDKMTKSMRTPLAHSLRYYDSKCNLEALINAPECIPEPVYTEKITQYSGNLITLQVQLPTPQEVKQYVQADNFMV